jgi:type III pantothenate kinase
MDICMDIGNTRTKVGVFNRGSLVGDVLVLDNPVRDVSALALRYPLKYALVSAVSDAGSAVLQALRSAGVHALELTAQTPLPFSNAYHTPQTLGKDRLAAVAGAHALFPGRNALVVDAGTCIKYDLLDAEGVYHGGNIAPGLHMRLRAMHEQTARLPMVPFALPEAIFGQCTQTALQNGGLRGAILEVQGFIQLFSAKWPQLVGVLTGGDAPFLQPHLGFPGLVHEPALLLKGLHHILTHNL